MIRFYARILFGLGWVIVNEEDETLGSSYNDQARGMQVANLQTGE